MGLTQVLGTFFSSGDRERGESYFDLGRVSLDSAAAGWAYATVEGTEEYQVSIDTSGSGDMNCDCPRFMDTHACKHLWATILALEASGSPSSRAAAPPEATLDELIDEQRQAIKLSRRWTPFSLRSLTEPLEEVFFHLDLSQASHDEPLEFRALRRKRLKSGKMSQLRPITTHRYGVPDAEVERTLQQFPACDDYAYAYATDGWRLPPAFTAAAISKLAELGTWVWTWQGFNGPEAPHELRWDDGPPFQLQLHFQPVGKKRFELRASLERGDEVVELSDLVWAYCDGVLMFEDRLAQVEPIHVPWIHAFRELRKPMRLTSSESKAVLARFASLDKAPGLLLDEKLGVDHASTAPRGALMLEWTNKAGLLEAQVQFIYDSVRVDWNQPGDFVFAVESGQRMPRNQVAESGLVEQLLEFPFVDTQSVTYQAQRSEDNPYGTLPLTLKAKDLLATVKSLNELGWEIRAEGQAVRTTGEFPDAIVTSGTDWFDVAFEFRFDDDDGNAKAGLPALLEAVHRKQRTVLLDDGTLGLIPEEWLERNGKLLQMGVATEEGVRFRRTQAFIVDALLAEAKHKRKDPNYARIVQRLKQFDGIRPEKPSPEFQGELRPYQQQGLGWFRFLKDFGFGGCLADEMGLGKTVQVLALLEKRRVRRATPKSPKRPSLVVAPKSLIFNWLDEAKRFTPKLKVLDYTGGERKMHRPHFEQQHVILTTYGTLMRDIEFLKDVEFDYVILDEAQAIKNARSQTAKACRLLLSSHRLAMTGTPVENRLDDLWSIMEFLNPGMLGKLPVFQGIVKGKHSPENLDSLRAALSPFILRRLKEEVLTELPAKTEQTLAVELPPAQRRLYDELRDHYHAKLCKQISKHGLKKSKMHILEALLRTRQAACDARLLDKDCRTVGGKVAFLAEQLQSVVNEGHKALVFSQFTSLLALVREALCKRGIPFEHLDGASKGRGERVKRFQEDPDLPVFLISLKAGGHGLNLTAADYVFILDPWWNPAAESQAIDRAHRMGQTKSVNAYRLIAKDTIEEKIVQLQNHKRRLADSIVTANSNLMRDLTTEDLKELFS